MNRILTPLFLLFAWAAQIGQAEAQGSVTWASDVATIVYNKCGTCHRPGSIAPFELLTYENAYNNRFAIQYAVTEHIMPPWPPDNTYRAMAHNRSLTDAEIDLINTWVNQDAPQGNPAQAPQVPDYSVAAFGTPDLVMAVPTYTVTAQVDSYRRFVVHNDATEDRFFQLLEATPGNRAIVHHILVYEDTTGQAALLDAQSPDEPGYDAFAPGSPQGRLIGAWVPGNTPIPLPPGMGFRLRAGADLMVEIHYPEGTTGETDSSKLSFYFTPTQQNIREVFLESPINYLSPEWLAWLTGSFINPWPLAIPADSVVRAIAQYNLPWYANVSVLQVAPHMHFIAASTKTYAVTPANDTIPIISIPHWDFHWQGFYTLPKMLPIPASSRIVCETVYDNTTDNEHNPSFPPVDVFGGEATTDEMLLVYFAYTLYQPGDENIVLADSTIAPLVGLPHISRPREETTVRCYPNPATGQVSVMYYLPAGVAASQIRVHDAAGRIMTSQELDNRQAGYHSIPLSVGQYASGLYRVTVVTDRGLYTENLIVR